MKKKELSITKNSRFSISQAEKITEYVEKYSYENESEFIRSAVLLLMKYHDYKDKFKDPEELMKFAQEIDPLIQTEKKQECMESLLINSSEEELERFYFVISKERHKRASDKNQSAKDKKLIIQEGGETEPKVGYRLSRFNNVEFYRPITPDENEWHDLSKEDKEVLLLDLEKKLMDLESIKPKPYEHSGNERFLYLRGKIEKISKGISDEKECL